MANKKPKLDIGDRVILSYDRTLFIGTIKKLGENNYHIELIGGHGYIYPMRDSVHKWRFMKVDEVTYRHLEYENEKHRKEYFS